MTGENTGDNPRRVLLKLSGEAFGGGKVGIDTSVIRRIAEEIVPAVQQGVQIAIVVGGGNFFFRMLHLFVCLPLRVLLRLRRLPTSVSSFMGTTFVNHAGRSPPECMLGAGYFSVTRA